MDLTKGQLEVMATNRHLLVTGGPGSGKTTVSILKAAQIVEQDLCSGQKILFLSFARATVSRVVEAIERERKIPPMQKRLIDVETYHSFFWRLLKAHGYLIGLPRQLAILTPPGEAIAFSEIRAGCLTRNLTDAQKADKKYNEAAERDRLAMNEGRVCFDLYAPYVGKILHGSQRIRRLVATMYPFIILDEFQDTNEAQWRVVQALGEFCQLITLADPEQRIYDWIGANPARLDQFRKAFVLKEVNLGTDNHRSIGTEIAMFGNDLLRGEFRQNTYQGIVVDDFDPFQGSAMTKLVKTIDNARQRLIKQSINDWSLAILVPTKKMTRSVSDFLCQTEVPHVAVIEMEAAILGVEIITFLMQPGADDRHFTQFINLICSYFQGKGGNKPTQGALEKATSLRKAYDKLVICKTEGNAIRKDSIILKTLAVYEQTRTLVLTGDPDKDWQAMRFILANGVCERLREVTEAVKNIRILERGTQLRQTLSQDWRDNGGYLNALSITQQAFTQEHFSTTAKPEMGVVVMNMHKAKGKQFDEVIIFEGWPIERPGQKPYNRDRIVQSNSRDQIDDQARQNFRVSVTRAKRMTTILTPKNDPCVLLPSLNRNRRRYG